MLLYPPRSWRSWVCKETRRRHSSFKIHSLAKTMLKRSFSTFHRGNRKKKNYSMLQAENYFCRLQTTSLMFLWRIVEQVGSHLSSSKSAPCSQCWSSYEPSAPTHSAEVWEVLESGCLPLHLLAAFRSWDGQALIMAVTKTHHVSADQVPWQLNGLKTGTAIFNIKIFLFRVHGSFRFLTYGHVAWWAGGLNVPQGLHERGIDLGAAVGDGEVLQHKHTITPSFIITLLLIIVTRSLFHP